MILKIVIGAALAAAATSTIADLTYARWGETPDQLISMSGGAVLAIPPKDDERIYDLDYLARSNGTWRGVPVEFRFHFTQGTHQLAAVKLTPTDVSQCEQMKAEASSAFGSGTVSKEVDESQYPNVHFTQNLSIDWVDAARINRMQVVDVAAGDLHFCHLIFRHI